MMPAPDPKPTSARGMTLVVDDALLPLEVGTVVVDQISGQLAKAPARQSLNFTFALAGYPYDATVSERDGVILVSGETAVGRLPYSVENRKQRDELLRVVTALPGSGLGGGVGRDQTIRVGVQVSLQPPATAARIVAILVEHLMPAQPYIDLLAELAKPPAPAVPALPAPSSRF